MRVAGKGQRWTEMKDMAGKGDLVCFVCQDSGQGKLDQPTSSETY